MAECYMLVFLVIITLQGTAEGLKCYSCTDVDIKSGGNSIGSILGVQRDLKCENDPEEKYTECDHLKESCGYFSGSVTFNFLFSKVSTHIVSRQCLPKASVGCHTDSKTAKDAIKFFSFLGALLSFGSVESVTASVCTCNSDKCDANMGCISGFKSGDSCVEWWVIGAAVGGLAFLIVIIVCISCCCSKKSHRGAVHGAGQLSTFHVAPYNGAFQAQTVTSVMMSRRTVIPSVNMVAGPVHQMAPGPVHPPPYTETDSKHPPAMEKY